MANRSTVSDGMRFVVVLFAVVVYIVIGFDGSNWMCDYSNRRLVYQLRVFRSAIEMFCFDGSLGLKSYC